MCVYIISIICKIPYLHMHVMCLLGTGTGSRYKYSLQLNLGNPTHLLCRATKQLPFWLKPFTIA